VIAAIPVTLRQAPAMKVDKDNGSSIVSSPLKVQVGESKARRVQALPPYFGTCIQELCHDSQQTEKQMVELRQNLAKSSRYCRWWARSITKLVMLNGKSMVAKPGTKLTRGHGAKLHALQLKKSWHS